MLGYNIMGLDIKIIREQKEKIRKKMIRRLRSQNSALRGKRSRQIQEKLLLTKEFKTAGTVMVYVSLPEEVDTYYFIKEALKQGKRIAVPYIEPPSQKITASELKTLECLKKGPFGIYQPEPSSKKTVALKKIDLIMVPAIAYDNNNMRLGRGKGFYDRFLSERDLSSVKTIGLAFKFQIVDSLPASPHDRPVLSVITD